MRIISGKYKGKRLFPPKNFPSRPTTDMAKEGLFNILENKLHWEEIRCLDLFAGTGNISMELLSRGCLSVLSVDNHPLTFRHLTKMKTELDDNNWSIQRKDAYKFIAEYSLKFDLIFADPPFGLKGVEEIPDRIFGKPIIEDDGMLIIEHGKEISFKDHSRFNDERNYGGVCFSFFS